jgi:hypothetical protein
VLPVQTLDKHPVSAILFTMKTPFHLFLMQTHRGTFGSASPMLLLPACNRKGDRLWVPLRVIFDMSRMLLLSQRRNFREDYAKTIQEKLSMIPNLQSLASLELVQRWHPFHGEQLLISPKADTCFPLVLSRDMATHPLRIRRYPTLADENLLEWHFTEKALLQFFMDPRFQGLIVHAGFHAVSNQLQLDLIA